MRILFISKASLRASSLPALLRRPAPNLRPRRPAGNLLSYQTHSPFPMFPLPRMLRERYFRCFPCLLPRRALRRARPPAPPQEPAPARAIQTDCNSYSLQAEFFRCARVQSPESLPAAPASCCPVSLRLKLRLREASQQVDLPSRSQSEPIPAHRAPSAPPSAIRLPAASLLRS